MSSNFKQYRRKALSELRPYVSGEDLTGISVSNTDKQLPSLDGGFIARNPLNHEDQWYVAEKYASENLELIESYDNKNGEKAELRKATSLTFGQAIEVLKLGKKVAREGWNGKGLFLFLVKGSTFKVNREPLISIYPEGTEINYCPHIDMKAADGSIFAWNPNNLDILAEDWVIVE